MPDNPAPHIARKAPYAVEVEAGKKYFVNVGAVGQPRDNNPTSAYVVYDVTEGTIELRRLEYDERGAASGDGKGSSCCD